MVQIKHALEAARELIDEAYGEGFAYNNPPFWIEYAKAIIAERSEQSRHDDSVALGRAIVSLQ